MNFRLQEIITKVAKENGISFEQAKHIFESQFKCTREIMKEGVHDNPDTFKNVNLINLGKIYCKKGVIKRMIATKNSKK